mmetsp:Transcript_43824/g.91186  ORF Transcript_43824/g.91186 Transcript_43824/m.91186 type:complete len:83 (+) Transcript_43824:282-530(+)
MSIQFIQQADLLSAMLAPNISCKEDTKQDEQESEDSVRFIMQVNTFGHCTPRKLTIDGTLQTSSSAPKALFANTTLGDMGPG